MDSLRCTERFEGAELPEVEIVDMKEQRKKKISHGSLFPPAHA